ncbi:MAG TPA: RDD family protein, partial [Dehalococcoidia bacterium]|nr:RDD family protein [Dehalococcoidia bacterium]
FQLLASSDFGEQDPPEAGYWAFVSILMGTILFWSVFTLAIVWWRGQTAGQYVAGLRIQRLDGGKPTFGQLLRWWFGLNPLFFNPLMMIPWLLLAGIAITRALNVAALATTGGLALLCLLVPIVALVTALIGERRPLHDRLSGTTVVAAE